MGGFYHLMGKLNATYVFFHKICFSFTEILKRWAVKYLYVKKSDYDSRTI